MQWERSQFSYNSYRVHIVQNGISREKEKHLAQFRVFRQFLYGMTTKEYCSKLSRYEVTRVDGTFCNAGNRNNIQNTGFRLWGVVLTKKTLKTLVECQL